MYLFHSVSAEDIDNDNTTTTSEKTKQHSNRVPPSALLPVYRTSEKQSSFHRSFNPENAFRSDRICGCIACRWMRTRFIRLCACMRACCGCVCTLFLLLFKTECSIVVCAPLKLWWGMPHHSGLIKLGDVTCVKSVRFSSSALMYRILGAHTQSSVE